jgi:hypothetical protein
MAAVNARRLGLNTPWWRPVGIGVASLVLDALLGLWLDSYLLSVVLYLGALVLIWLADLRVQADEFKRQVSPFMRQGGWLVPILSGLPVAPLVFFAFVVAPLSPLEPRQVCEKFNQARGEEEAKKYTTLNLWPALATLMRADDSNNPNNPIEFELTDEALAPSEIGGYLVGYRTVFKDGGNHTQVEGVFHLVQRHGEWKIEDIYFTSFNRQPLEKWMSVARDYQQMAEAARQQQAVVPPKTSPPANTQKQSDNQTSIVRPLVVGLFAGGKAKAVGVFLVAVLLALARFGKGLIAQLFSGSAKQQTNE